MGSRRRNWSIAPCLVAFQPQERQGNRRAVVSSRLVANVERSLEASLSEDRASQRTRQCIHRTLVDPMSPLPPSRQTFRSLARRWGKCPQEGFAEGRGQKRLAAEWPGSYIHVRTVPPLSLLERSLGLLLLLLLFGEGRAPGPGDTDTRQPANLAPRPKPCFFSASASILVSTLRCWAIPSGEESAVEDDQPEKKRWPVRDADARTYTHWHRGRLHVLRLRQTLTTERPEILLGDSAGQDITGQV